MLKPEMPNMAGMPSMNDAFDFMKRMWSGGMNVPNAGVSPMPGMAMPTFSVEEINKQIADLKAVEAWLGVNMSMLRTTIQALEVQSATLSALQSMGQNFESAMKAATAPQAAPASPAERKSGIDEQAAKKSATRPETKEAVRTEAKGKTQNAKSTGGEPGNGVEFAGAMANPAAWWNLLQNQFNQAVGDALADDAPKTSKAAAKKTSVARRRKSPPPVA